MPAFKWVRAKGPSAGLVKEHYVKRRLAELQTVDTTIAARMKQAIEQTCGIDGNATPFAWIDVASRATEKLQACDLTINFHASSWFATENDSESYAQMYQRAKRHYDPKTKTSQTFLMDAGTNPAAQRARVDDQVTFPQAWQNQATTHRGLRPGAQSGDRIARQMEFGAARHVNRAKLGDPGTTESGILPGNLRFNPDTKQIFAALNYCGCPQGGAPSYGKSYFVLSDRLKVNGVYIPGDTFNIVSQPNPTQNQIPYSNLSALLGASSANLFHVMGILNYTEKNLRAPSIDPSAIVEAHIFDDVVFRRDLTEVVVFQPNETEADNAKTFAKKHGAKCYFS